MKKLMRILLLIALLTAALCITAAADNVTGAGFYSIGTAADVKITPQASTGSVEQCSAEVDDAKTGYETLFVGSDKLSVEVSNLTNGNQYLVLLVAGDGTTVTEDTILYINQAAAADGKVTFDVYPILPTEKTDLTLIITGAGGYTRKDISLSYATSGTYEKQPYKLGDVNNDSDIDAKDALKVLRAAAELEELTPTQKLAANVNGDSDVDAKDALKILRFAANLITEW